MRSARYAVAVCTSCGQTVYTILWFLSKQKVFVDAHKQFMSRQLLSSCTVTFLSNRQNVLQELPASPWVAVGPKFTDSCLYITRLAVNLSCVQFFVVFILRPVNCKISHLGLIYFGLICSKLPFSFCCLMVQIILVLPHTHTHARTSLLTSVWYLYISISRQMVLFSICLT